MTPKQGGTEKESKGDYLRTGREKVEIREVEEREVWQSDKWNQEHLKRLGGVVESDTRLDIRLASDLVFKKASRDKKALAGLPSTLLGILLDKIRASEFLDIYLHRGYTEDREGILDVKVHLNNDTRINVETQINVYPSWGECPLFYLSKMFTGNFKKGGNYSALEIYIRVSISGLSLTETDGLHSVIELCNRKNGRLYSDRLSLRVAYLNRLEHAPEMECQIDIYQWVKMVFIKDWKALKIMSEQNEATREVYEETEKINANSGLRWQYLKEEMKTSDEATLHRWCF